MSYWGPHGTPLNDEPDSKKTVAKYVDRAMFDAAPLKDADRDHGPKVTLVSMTADPLGEIACAGEQYRGNTVTNLSAITDDQREFHWDAMQRTHLKAPLEYVQLHFVFEGVTRAFTHQLVRQRTATYSQESLRFAVVGDLVNAVGLPPSLADTTGDETLGCEDSTVEWQRNVWDDAVKHVQEAYEHLIASGMPAEDARGLLPTNTLTRVHYRTNLRDLVEHSGNRLCTQAQFEWKVVWAQMVKAIRDCPVVPAQRWQYSRIADLFKPICFQTGKCEFRSNMDRSCNIRSRVDANAQISRPSLYWGVEHDEVEGNPIVAGVGSESVVRNEVGQPVFIGAIKPVEWLADPSAARKEGGGYFNGQ